MKGIFSKKNRKYYLTIIFAVILFLLPTHPAKACILGWDPISSCILEGTSYFVYLIFTLVGKGIAALAVALQAVINIPVYPDGGIAVIDESWKIMRNFANMFFIVALIIMAFATIFDVFPGVAKYNARALFGRFLFTALLINFSLVLGVLVIQGTQVLSNTFLTAIGDMSGRLGQTLNPSLLLPNPGQTTLTASAVDNATFGAFISLVFALVLAATFLFSILTALIFALIRIPILWALLVVSPIAWIMNIFPAGEGTFKRWWSTFIGWNMFLPIFLFFLYFGLYFLQNQSAVMQAIAAQTRNQSLGEGVPFSLQQLFFYVLAGIFLIGGTIVAMKASMFSGTGVTQVAGWARGVAARRLGLAQRGEAAKQKWEQVQKEGLPTRFGQAIFGGERGYELEVAKRARQLGVRGALEKGIDIEKEKQKPFANNVTELRRLADSGSTEQKAAARMRLTELGALDSTRVTETYQWLGGDRSEAANKYIGGVDFGKFSTDDRKKFASSLTNIEAVKKNAMAMIEKDKLDATQIEELVQKVGIKDAAGNIINLGEIKDMLEKGNKKNLLAVSQAKVNLAIEGARSIDEELQKALRKMSEDQILETMNDPAFGDLIKNPEVRHSMNEVLGKNPKRLANMASKSSGDTQKRLERMAGAARRIQNKPKIKDLKDKEVALIPQINQAKIELYTIEKQIRGLQGQMDPKNPNSTNNQRFRIFIAQLDKKQAAKDNEVKSLSDKRDKINERIDSIRKGDPIAQP